MLEESDRAWDKVATRSYAFHALRDECVHLRVLSLQQVGAWGGRELPGTGSCLVAARRMRAIWPQMLCSWFPCCARIG